VVQEVGDGGQSLMGGSSFLAVDLDASVPWEPAISDGLLRGTALTFAQGLPSGEAILGLSRNAAWQVWVGEPTFFASRAVSSMPLSGGVPPGPAMVAQGRDGFAAVGERLLRLTPADAGLLITDVGAIDGGMVLTVLPSGPSSLVGTATLGGSMSLFELDLDGGSPRLVPLPFGQGLLLVGQDGYWLLASARTSNFFDSRLCRLPWGANAWTCTETYVDELFAIGFLADGDQILVTSYSSSNASRIRSFDRVSLALRWSLEDPDFFIPSVLGCSPDGRSGYLAGYAYTDQRGLIFRALNVDAPGLDSEAPWPMPMHDPAHTSNAATPLGAYRCPR
jgi:hypothetical protein